MLRKQKKVKMKITKNLLLRQRKKEVLLGKYWQSAASVLQRSGVCVPLKVSSFQDFHMWSPKK